MTIKPSNNTPRINEEICSQEVYLIGFNDSQLGVVSLSDALEIARDSELDLVEVAGNANPSVCKLMNYGKHIYQQNKKKKGAQKVKAVKQVEVRPSTDEGDIKTKINQIEKFLLSGHKVKLSVKYKGREMSHQQIGIAKLKMISDKVSTVGRSDGHLVTEGRKHFLILSPI